MVKEQNKLFEKLDQSLQVFFELFFKKNGFVTWIIGVFLCGMVLILLKNMWFQPKTCSIKKQK